MNQTPGEAELCQAFRQAAVCYGRALERAEGLADLIQQGGPVEGPLQEVLAGLQDAAGIDTHIAELREQWHRAGRKPGPELQQEIDRVAELIRRLAEWIGQAERAALLHQARLQQELETLVRSKQMRSAYGAVRAAQLQSTH